MGYPEWITLVADTIVPEAAPGAPMEWQAAAADLRAAPMLEPGASHCNDGGRPRDAPLTGAIRTGRHV